jgi:hypothetical protein
VKKKLNTRAVANMTYEYLQEVDPTGEVLEWFNAIKSRIS